MSFLSMVTPFIHKPAWRRGGLLLIAMGALLLMGLYTLADARHLSADHALNGADWMGYAVCHRLTERSFMINGRQFPLCARCTGMYLGAALVFLALGMAGRWRWSELPPLPIILVLLAFIALMGVDGLNSYTHFFPGAPHLYEPRNWLRLVTGMGTGLAMGSFIFPSLGQVLWREQLWQPAIGSWRELGGLMLLTAVGTALLLSNQPLILYVLALMSVAGLLTLLASINLVLGLVLLKKEGQISSWRGAILPLMVGFTLAISELTVIGMVRFHFTGTMIGFPGL